MNAVDDEDIGPGEPLDPDLPEDNYTAQVPTNSMNDSDVEQLAVDYLDYDPANTYVVSGPIPGSKFPGKVRTRGEARVWAMARFGARWVKEIVLPLRWAHRVRKP